MLALRNEGRVAKDPGLAASRYGPMRAVTQRANKALSESLQAPYNIGIFTPFFFANAIASG